MTAISEGEPGSSSSDLIHDPIFSTCELQEATSFWFRCEALGDIGLTQFCGLKTWNVILYL